MNKNEWIHMRSKILTKMLDSPRFDGIYRTTVAFAELDDLFDEMAPGNGPSWAQIDRDNALKAQQGVPKGD